ncbi:hypothetical protein AJ80_02121 [Polytolypa hystricis UAMH7299]|uniref:DNA helicase n=1 Tax=Polytolypa hystricis (strain UAMH7299) TaxID=1447883 RepID=A0A2B7YSM5_POLH7|nr:hypothetical protein AJ80_02121 [Polytolypa hystricis UAMH7299]
MEDRVLDTPLRKQAGEQSLALHNSDDEYGSGSELETVATAPLYQNTIPTQILNRATLENTQRLTQPTQIIERPPPLLSSPSRPNPSVVQVATSSPLAPTSSVSRPTMSRPGALGSAIAPSGTRFCPPAMARGPVRRTPVINLDDEEPTYRGGSSDEDDIQFVVATDIKPSTFTRSIRSPEKEKVLESPVAAGSSNDRFKEITASAFYNPAAGGVGTGGAGKRLSGNMSSAASTSDRSPKRVCSDSLSGNLARQNNELQLSNIEDYQIKTKVRRMLSVFPNKSVQVCLDALMDRDGNYENALEYLASLEGRNNANALSDDELSLDHKTPVAAPAKQQIKSRARIQDKWASSQRPPTQKDQSDKTVTKQRGRLIRGSRSRAISPDSARPGAVSAPKKPGRLIRGRKTAPRVQSASPEPIVLDDSESSDAEASLPSEDERTLEAKVLRFFNTCSIADLTDIADISEGVATTLIAHRRFPSLRAVRQVTHEDGSAKAPKPGAKARKSTKKPIGDKIVDKCLDMWTGYEAVDALVTQCESLSQPVALEMKRWGVDIFGAKTDGELELVSLDKGSSDSTHDSGIGTPSSRRSVSEDGDDIKEITRKKNFIDQPSIMSENIKMKDYQVVGINWLNLLFQQNLSCILADDMGLGKTCQVIAFFAHLYETGVKGPHLVVVPSSTLENWLREFSVFCPKLSVMPYYADQATRADIREQIINERDDINVVVTTYTIAKAKVDASFLRSMNFCVCVYDEGHMLKSSKSVLYEKLIRIPARFRLLLTGTPLQNNLQELASLLGFILPSVFKEHKEDLEYIFRAKAKTLDNTHSALLSAQRIARAKSMLAPFVLRRKKHQVIDLPAKIARVEYCEMNAAQREIYDNETEGVRQLIADRAAGKKVSNKSANILMKLRQAAIHPLFYRRLYDEATLTHISKACLKDEKWAESDPNQIFIDLTPYNDFEVHTLCASNPKSLGKFALKNEEWMMSGKVEKLCELLKKFKENGDRTLVFSQFTMVMDILEDVLETLQMQFFRLDGSTSVEDRQSTLDAFHDNTDIPVFLLSTKAGGAGINLACANKVIIFDSSFNPQEDVQAENRAHRVGQTREVEVVRLVTKDTIEEQIYALGQTKLALDQRVAGEEEGGVAACKKGEEDGLKAVEDMVIANFTGEKEEDKGKEDAAEIIN